MKNNVFFVNDNLIENRFSSTDIHQVLFSEGVFNPQNHDFARHLPESRILVVLSGTINKLYGQIVREYFESRRGREAQKFLVVECGEKNKNLETVAEVCKAATEMNLKRKSVIVAIGGGVCTDICGFASAVYDRGVPHIKVPTTLVGFGDAGIGIKNGVNFCGRKNNIGSFSHPQLSVLDSTFLLTLDERQLRCGLAEVIKLATVYDLVLFRAVEANGDRLVKSRMQGYQEESVFILKRAVLGILELLNDNIYEVNSYARALDFGHTFSPSIEVSTNHQVLHGEAVAIDIAISSAISKKLGVLSEKDFFRLIGVIKNCGLDILHPAIDAGMLWRGLDSIIAHRNGELNLVIPAGIGACTFLRDPKELNKTLLMEALELLRGIDNA
jgi:2-epi-5-epi-valiolone synthase